MRVLLPSRRLFCFLGAGVLASGALDPRALLAEWTRCFEIGGVGDDSGAVVQEGQSESFTATITVGNLMPGDRVMVWNPITREQFYNGIPDTWAMAQAIESHDSAQNVFVRVRNTAARLNPFERNLGICRGDVFVARRTSPAPVHFVVREVQGR